MILISNDCCAGYIYKYTLKTKFNSPTIWSSLCFNDFYYLVKNYNKINFLNYEINRDDPNKLEKFYIYIDNNIKLYFNHYRFDINEKVPKQDGINVYYNKIWEYIVEKYKIRTERMKTDNQICFVFHIDGLKEDYKSHKYDKQIKDLISYCETNKIKLLLLTENPMINDYNYVKEIIVTRNWFNEINSTDIQNQIKSFLIK